MIKYIAAFFMIIVSNSSLALPILQGTVDAATGISNLEINGVEYDVDFIHSTAVEAYDSSLTNKNPFFSDYSSNENAVDTVRQFLIENLVTMIDGTITDSQNTTIFKVPYLVYQESPVLKLRTYGGIKFDGEEWYGTRGIQEDKLFDTVNWATFVTSDSNHVNVPEPASILLLWLGLLGIGYSRKKQ